MNFFYYISLFAQVLLILGLGSYIVFATLEFYFRLNSFDFEHELDAKRDQDFQNKYFKHPLRNSFWVWVVQKSIEAFAFGWTLKLGPLYGVWMIPLLCIGMMAIVYVEAPRRFRTWSRIMSYR